MFLALTLAGASPAGATPLAGQPLPEVAVVGTDGRRRTLPARQLVSVVIYEDAEAGKQNQRVSALIDAITNVPENKAKVEAIAVADLEKWNWWPARSHALNAVKKVAAKIRAVLYLDWTAEVRRTWRLEKKKSGILVFDPQGLLRFAAEGPLSDLQLQELLRTLTSLGAAPPPSVPQGVTPYHEIPVTPNLPKRP